MMKKFLFAAIALAVVAFAPSNSAVTTKDEIHLHNHAEAAGIVTWQCRNCGQISRLRPGTLPASYGCDGEFTKRHVWERLD